MVATETKAAARTTKVVGSARLTMWMLMIIPWLACHCVRKGLPLLIEFIVRDFGYSDLQKAQLLGSFCPSRVPCVAHLSVV